MRDVAPRPQFVRTRPQKTLRLNLAYKRKERQGPSARSLYLAGGRRGINTGLSQTRVLRFSGFPKLGDHRVALCTSRESGKANLWKFADFGGDSSRLTGMTGVLKMAPAKYDLYTDGDGIGLASELLCR